MSGASALAVGGVLSLIAAALHIGCIVGGGDWYRFFGAGEGMARMAEAGLWRPTLTTLAIALVLTIWSLYAFSGAGVLPRLPLLRTALVLISTVYLVRGLAPVAILLSRPAMMSQFWFWSSLIVLVYGLIHAFGTWRAWPALAPAG